MADSLLSQRRMLTTSARDKYGNRIRGQGIRSAETAQAESDFRAQALRGLANIQRRSLLSRVRGEAPGKSDTPDSQKPMSQLYADQRKSRMEYYARIQGRQPAAAPAAAPGATTTPATAAPKAPPREGRINGMPASQAIEGVRQSLLRGGPAQEYGSEIAKKNLGENVTNESFREALADYQRRSALDAGRAERGAAYAAGEQEPGSYRSMVEPVGPKIPGPLQLAMQRNLAKPLTPYKPGESVTPAYDAAMDARLKADFGGGFETRPTNEIPTPEWMKGSPDVASSDTPSKRPSLLKKTKPQISVRFLNNEPPSPEPKTMSEIEAEHRRRNKRYSEAVSKPTPSWMQGTGLGKTLEFLSKPTI